MSGTGTLVFNFTETPVSKCRLAYTAVMGDCMHTISSRHIHGFTTSLYTE